MHAIAASGMPRSILNSFCLGRFWAVETTVKMPVIVKAAAVIPRRVRLNIDPPPYIDNWWKFFL
jgi:hypothetical protein